MHINLISLKIYDAQILPFIIILLSFFNCLYGFGNMNTPQI